MSQDPSCQSRALEHSGACLAVIAFAQCAELSKVAGIQERDSMAWGTPICLTKLSACVAGSAFKTREVYSYNEEFTGRQ